MAILFSSIHEMVWINASNLLGTTSGDEVIPLCASRLYRSRIAAGPREIAVTHLTENAGPSITIIFLVDRNGAQVLDSQVTKPTGNHSDRRVIGLPLNTGNGASIPLGRYTVRFQHGNRIIALGTVTLQ